MSVLKLIVLFSIVFINNTTGQTAANSSPKLFFEKVYLHTDREIYTQGNDIWFSAFLVNAQDNKFINTSNTLYVELLSVENKKAKVADKKIIRIEQGFGNGDFKLNDSIPSGTYHLRAWTNWMRNFGDHFLYEKEIKILKIIETRPQIQSEKNKITVKKPITPITPIFSLQDDIQFLPEGGSMIDSVAALIAFKAVDINGKNLGLEGDIINSKGDLITSIASKNGIGVFMIEPFAGEVYTAKGVYSNGKPFNKTLPKVLNKGFGIRVIDKDSVINIIISSNNKSQVLEKDALLLAKNHGKNSVNIQFTVHNLQSLIQLNKKDLPEGITAITLYDYNGKPQCERLIYVAKKEKPIIKITTDKPIYTPKEKVMLTVKTLDAKNNPIKAILSLAVLDANLIPENKTSIVSYLMLESELKGKIDNPKQYFDENNTNRLKSLDLLLLTQGWRDFMWRKLADSAINTIYASEGGITITGKVKQIMANNPIENANISMFANGAKGDKLFADRSKANGEYTLEGLEIYGPQIIKLTSTTDKGKKNGWIRMDSIFKDLMSSKKYQSPVVETAVEQKIAAEILSRQQLVKKGSIKDTIALKEVKIVDSKKLRLFDDVGSEFGYPVESFDVTKDDYDIYNLRTYILYKSKQAMEVENPDSPGLTRIVFPYFGKKLEPKIFVNGKELPIRETDPQEVKDDYYNTYYSLAMNKVEKIVIKHLVGSSALALSEETGMSTSGPPQDLFVIFLTLKPDALENRKFNSILEEVNGYYTSRSFYKPQFQNEQSTDLRTTINWTPIIKTNENGDATVTFYNSGIKTKARINVEGLTLDGLPLTSETYYEVR